MLNISLLVYLLLLIVMATLLAKRMAGLKDFFLAGRSLPVIAITITFVASWFGAGSTIGTMNEAYHQGISAIWLIAIPSVLSCLVVSLFLAKKVRQLDCLSQPEAVEQYYGPVSSFLLACIILASITTFIASQLVAASDLLHLTMNLSPEVSTTLILGAIILYSMIGGFRAVVMTDILQFIGFTLAILILLAFELVTHGGNPLPASQSLPAGFWNPLNNLGNNLAMVFTFVLAWSIAPEMWQRMSSTRSPKDAQFAALGAGFTLAALYSLVLITGLLAVGHLPPESAGRNVLVEMALQLPSPILVALVLVGVLSAMTSTIDSSLNVGSLTLVRNIIQRYFWPQASHTWLIKLSRIATVLIGIPAALIALKYRDIIQVLWISADIYASTMFVPLIGLFYINNVSRLSGIMAMIFGICPVILNFLNDFHLLTLPQWWPGWPYTTILGVSLSLAGLASGMLCSRLSRLYNSKKPLTIERV